MHQTPVVTREAVALVGQRDRDLFFPAVAGAVLGPRQVAQRSPVGLQLVRGQIQITEVIEQAKLLASERGRRPRQGRGEGRAIVRQDRFGAPVEQILYRDAVLVRRERPGRG